MYVQVIMGTLTFSATDSTIYTRAINLIKKNFYQIKLVVHSKTDNYQINIVPITQFNLR
jgi:hypothetical protein